MKKSITAKSLIVPLFLFFINTYAQVGVGTTTPTNTLDVNGWVKVGDQTATGSNVTGSIRYNSTNVCMEFYDGVIWKCIGQPKMQTFIINDGIDETLSGTGINYVNVVATGYGTIKTFTVNNVAPGSKILFLVEVGLNLGKKKNGSYANSYKIYGNGIFEQYEIASTGARDVVSYFAWGNPNNASTNNLTFNFECNQEYNNLKITTLVF